MSTGETRDVVAGYVAALRRGDLDALRASFTPKATWTIRGDIPVAELVRTYPLKEGLTAFADAEKQDVLKPVLICQ